MQWQDNLITTDDQLRELLSETRTIAVLGIKPEDRAGQPAFYVPQYMQERGYDIIPVPVYYPQVTEILGRPVYRTLASIPDDVDMVNVFRRSQDVAAHLDDILAKRPKSVWLQMGIRDDKTAETLAREGIKVVQDMCLMVVDRMFNRGSA